MHEDGRNSGNESRAAILPETTCECTHFHPEWSRRTLLRREAAAGENTFFCEEA